MPQFLWNLWKFYSSSCTTINMIPSGHHYHYHYLQPFLITHCLYLSLSFACISFGKARHAVVPFHELSAYNVSLPVQPRQHCNMQTSWCIHMGAACFPHNSHNCLPLPKLLISMSIFGTSVWMVAMLTIIYHDCDKYEAEDTFSVKKGQSTI